MDLCLSSRLSMVLSPHTLSQRNSVHVSGWIGMPERKSKMWAGAFQEKMTLLAQVSNRNLPASVSKLINSSAPHSFFKPVAAKGSAERLCLCLLRLRRAWLLPLPFLSLILIVFSPILYTYRWAPPLGASGLSWRCCTAHTAEACLLWDLATATASTSWRAV